MTASLFVFVPVALLALIGGFCFVGCVLNTKGTHADDPPPVPPKPFTTYSKDVADNANCVAYWPLSDTFVPSDPAKRIAHDVVGQADGAFKSIDTDPALFPCPAANLSAGVDTAFAPGTLMLGVPGIVKGDAVQPLNDPAVLTTAMQCDGGFVSVNFTSVVNPPAPFTIELWAMLGLAPNDPAAMRTVIESRDAAGGFAIRVNNTGNWEGVLDVSGMAAPVVFTGAKATSAATHVVLTYDGANAALFTDGTRTSQVTSAPGFVRNTTMQLAIGVGATALPPRTQPSDVKFFPLVPFKGTIQDVAIYNTVLDDTTIKIHAEHGKGNSAD